VQIFPPLSPSQKECETNPSKEQKNVCLEIELAEEKSQSPLSKRHRGEQNKSMSRKRKTLV